MNAKTWQEHLAVALNTNDPEVMKTALAKVPPQHLQMTLQAVKDQGHGYYQRRQFAEALEAYTQVLSLGTKDYFVLLHRTDCLLQLQRYDEAHEAALQLVGLHPEYHKAFRLLAAISEARKDQPAMLDALKQALQRDPNDKQLAQQVSALEAQLKEKQDILNRVLNPDQVEPQPEIELPPLPEIAFDPAILENTQLPDVHENMRKGLTTFLQNFADLEAPRDLIARVEDPAWLEAWAKVLRDDPEHRWAIAGPEAGLLPMVAMEAGAKGVVCWDPYSLTRRLNEGNIQKCLVGQLQRQFGESWTERTKEERQQDFEQISKPYTLLQESPANLPDGVAACDRLILTQFEHDPMGKGMMRSLREFRAKALTQDACIFPSRLRVFACPIQWELSCAGFSLEALAEYHWNPYPLQVNQDSSRWRALAPAKCVAELELATLEPTSLHLEFALAHEGSLHGILYWYQLELGQQLLDTGPEGNLKWPGQAFQYLDTRAVRAGENLTLLLQVREDRLLFQSVPAIALKRSGALPPWHIHSGADNAYNRAYIEAVAHAVALHKPRTVLNIGAGNGLLALAAAQAGAHVYACETSELLCKALEANARSQGLDQRISVLQEDCRKLTIPEHLPDKVDMVIFDKFDCGLLGDGILHYLEYALAHLVVADAPILPRSASLKGRFIQRRIETLVGQNAVLLTPYLFSPEYIHVHLPRLPHRSLSESFELFNFDFAKAAVCEEEKQFSIEINQAGISGAVVFWYELDLDGERSLSTSPFIGQDHRGQALQFLPEIQLSAGEHLGIKVKHTGSNVMFGIDPESVVKENILALPRFDPNWLNGHRNIMQQSGQIMQQLRMNPSEYENAFLLASAFAAAPARFDLDANVAARYLHTFLAH